jgi:regulator of sigma E protease
LEQSPTPDRPDHLKPADSASTGGAGGGAESTGPEVAPLPEPLTPSAWLAANAPYLVVVGVLVGLLYYHSGIDGVYKAGLVAVGLGLVIFIHELGHFLAAKWCDVHVQTFSIGFGPALPGCSFQRGETTYKIAVLPLGGYVQMVGEGPEADENENYPRSFKNKTVGQRMLIISAGVIMNVLLACVCFIVVYRYHGVDRQPALVWRVEPGSPAWKAGVRTDSLITRIGKTQDPYFDDLLISVALSDSGEIIPITFKMREGDQFREVKMELEPRREKTDTRPVIGVGPPSRLKLYPEQARKQRALPVAYNSAAAAAAGPGGEKFEFGDRVIATTDPDQPEAAYDPGKVKELPPDPFNDKGDARDPFEFRRRMKLLAGKEVVIRVRRAGPDDGSRRATRSGADAGDEAAPPVDVRVLPAYHRTFGMRMKMGEIAAVRERSPAAEAGVVAAAPGLRGDVLRKVKLTFPDGRTVEWGQCYWWGCLRPLDPVRLPDDLAREVRDGTPTHWWGRLERAEVTLTVLRPGTSTSSSGETVLKPVPWAGSWKFNDEPPINRTSPLSIPQLGLAYRIESTVVEVTPGSPAAEAGIMVGDRITEVKFREAGKTADEEKWSNWLPLQSKDASKEDPYDQWAHCFWMLQHFSEFPEVKFKLKRDSDSAERELTLVAVPDDTWPLSDRGLLFVGDTRLQKADTLAQAAWMGAEHTGYFIKLIYLQLKSLLNRRISHENLGGPILIATQAFDAAGQDIFTLMLYLGMISVNLAVVNFLPIPVLDGGHMVFLIWEKLRGKPASDAVRIGATYVGVALLASLMIFVFYQDIARLLGM